MDKDRRGVSSGSWPLRTRFLLALPLLTKDSLQLSFGRAATEEDLMPTLRPGNAKQAEPTTK